MKTLSHKEIANKLSTVGGAQSDILYMLSRVLQTKGKERQKYVKRFKLMVSSQDIYLSTLLKELESTI
jgi:hypothetical protein